MKSSAARLSGAAVLSFLLAPTPVPAAAPAGRYTASGGVVKDNKTGLYWQQTAAPMTYTLASAMTYCSGNAAALPGTGWRLPAVKELATLIDDSVASPGPTIDASAFPATPASVFWSSTPATPPPFTWGVNFLSGEVSAVDGMLNVRCVR